MQQGRKKTNYAHSPKKSGAVQQRQRYRKAEDLLPKSPMYRQSLLFAISNSRGHSNASSDSRKSVAVLERESDIEFAKGLCEILGLPRKEYELLFDEDYVLPSRQTLERKIPKSKHPKKGSLSHAVAVSEDLDYEGQPVNAPNIDERISYGQRRAARSFERGLAETLDENSGRYKRSSYRH